MLYSLLSGYCFGKHSIQFHTANNLMEDDGRQASLNIKHINVQGDTT